ncbi:MAG: GTPase ObgE [Eubacterium sp.]|nr:GTPase ObgE [Eubacterium sp.]
MFADRAKIFVRSGKGGDGHVSFRRELYVPNGGPDGGDGGDGGNVVFIIDKGLNTLTDFRNIRKYKAEDGEEGRKRNCHGANGKDVVLKVPPGTVIRDFETGKVILDMADREEPVVLFKGGRGGKGNQHYVTSVMQAPKYAQPGQPAIEKYLTLELKMIADVGLVGFPSAGKSTLLSVTTNAKPKIAEYHFTTLVPNLGVVDLPDASGFVMADIPGIIEGASEGVGLGFDFLRHIERTRVLVHVVDAAGTEGRDPVEDVRQINEELQKYNAELASRPMILACNKMDLLDEEERKITMQFLEEAYKDRMVKILPISAATREGVRELLYAVSDLLKDLPKEKIIFEQELDPDSFRDTEQLSFTVEKSTEEEGVYLVEGPKIERMLGYTNLEDEKGFLFFQNFMKVNGILQQLEDLGIQDGETVRVYGHEFDYYHE